VAAVKENKSGTNFIRFGMLPGGRFTAENVPLRELLRFAFQVQPFQLEGVPGWATSNRFDITAKAENEIPPTGPGQMGPIQYMMRALLRDRFGLVYHNETKDMPIMNLVLARPDGKLGPKLEKSTTDCAAQFAARRAVVRWTWRARWAGGPGGPGGPGRGPGGPGRGDLPRSPTSASRAVRDAARPRQPVGRRPADRAARAVPVTEPPAHRSG
jgi:hypothetical protein